MAGDTPRLPKAPAWGRRQASPHLPKSRNPRRRQARATARCSLARACHRLRRSPTIQRHRRRRSKATCTGRIWAARCNRFRPRMALIWRNPAMNEQTRAAECIHRPHRNIEAGWCLFPSTEKHSRMGRCNLFGQDGGAGIWRTHSASRDATPVPGDVTLTAIERNVDYDGLPSVQAEMLRVVRQKLDVGDLPEPHPDRGMDRTWRALNSIGSIDKFDRDLEHYKAEGLYDRPKNTPWAAVPESKKVSALVRLRARTDGPPGATSWRRSSERSITMAPRGAARPWKGCADGWTPASSTATSRATRKTAPITRCAIAEFEAHVEDYKHLGGRDEWGVDHRWKEFGEGEKLDRIVRETGSLHLHCRAEEARDHRPRGR